MRFFKRSLFAVASVLTGTVLCTLFAVQISQWRARRQMAALAQDAAQLVVGTSTQADVDALLAKWRPWVMTGQQACSKVTCDYTIALDDWVGRSMGKFVIGMDTSIFAGKVAGLLHAHLPEEELYMTVSAGRLENASVRFVTDVPKGSGPECGLSPDDCKDYVPYVSGSYVLVATVMQTSKPRYAIEGPRIARHLHYTISEPDGCTICLAIIGDYLPPASREERAMLYDLDFSCVTRWKPCTVEGDIAPGMWRQYGLDGHHPVH